MRKSKNIRHRINPTFAVVVDGETEFWYLQMLKRNERGIRVNIKPEIPGNKSTKEQYNLVTDLSGREYSKVFWIVDLDKIIKESREVPKGRKSPLMIFIEYRAYLYKKFRNVEVIVNNPCFEYWLLLHFEKTSKIFDNCSAAENQLLKHLDDFMKTKKYFTKQDNDIYLKLKPHLKNAIQNSMALGKFDAQEPAKAMCEMESFFFSDELRKYFE